MKSASIRSSLCAASTAALLLLAPCAGASMLYLTTFDIAVDRVEGAIPGVGPGSVVSGSFIADWEQAAAGAIPVLDFNVIIGGTYLGLEDLADSEFLYSPETSGIAADFRFDTRADLGDLTTTPHGFNLFLFHELEVANAYLDRNVIDRGDGSYLTDILVTGGLALNHELLGSGPSTPVPEPSTWALMLLGGGLLFLGRRRSAWQARRGH